MTDQIFTRREFLKGTTRVGLSLTLATVLGPSPLPALAQNTPRILISQGTDVLNVSDVQHWIMSGLGGLWVAGQFLNAFASNLVFDNLPQELKQKYRLAGAESKSLPVAREIWQTIPAPIRARGPEALWKFHKGKDWSHIVPRSWGGPATAQNGIWWCSPCNKSLGARPMSRTDIALARSLLFFEGLRSTIAQTIRGGAKGGMVGVVLGALLGILEYGLDYAEGKITWREMTTQTVWKSIQAGSLGFIIAGIIIGISLAFPFLIPILAPLLIILQAVGLVFLTHQVIELGVGWWNALDVEQGLEIFDEILEDIGYNLREQYNAVVKGVRKQARGWLGIAGGAWEWVWAWADWGLRKLGIYDAFAWFAYQTAPVRKSASDFIASLLWWGYDPYVKVTKRDVEKSIADVVANEFKEAISTTSALRHSIDDFRSIHRRKSDPALLLY